MQHRREVGQYVVALAVDRHELCVGSCPQFLTTEQVVDDPKALVGLVGGLTQLLLDRVRRHDGGAPRVEFLEVWRDRREG